MAAMTKTFWSAAGNAALRVVAFWVLLFAAYLALGRQFFPYIETLKPEVEIWLSSQVGAPVSIGQLRGDWERFNPVVRLSDIQVGQNLTIEAMTLAPGLYESVSRGGLAFIRFELDNFSAELFQTASGWQMKGLAAADADGVKLNDLILLLQRQQEVRFSNTHLTIRPLTLPAFDLRLNQARLGGMGGDNGLVADAVLRAQGFNIPIQLQVETTQDPERTNLAYFKHGAIDIAPWLQGVGPQVKQALVAGEYWVNFDQHHWKDLTTRLHAEAIELVGSAATLKLQDLRAEAYLEHRIDGFDGWLNLLQGSANGQALPSTQAHIRRQSDRLSLQWDRLAVGLLGQWLGLNDRNGFWAGLQPSGFLDQGRLTRVDRQPESLRLTTAVTDLVTTPVQAVPGVERFNGSMQVNGARGQLTLAADDVPIYLPDLYTKPLALSAAAVQIAWQVDPEHGLFSQGSAALTLAVPSVNGLAIDQPLPLQLLWHSMAPTSRARQAGTNGALEIQVKGNQMDAPWVRFLANSRLLEPEAVRFVETRLRQGDFSRAELNYLSSSDKQRRRHSQFFINTSVPDLEMDFLDNWSPVTGVAGEFALTNAGLSLNAYQGRYPGFALSKMALALNFSDDRMTIDMTAKSSPRDALKFLQNGPLQLAAQASIADWSASDGEVDLALELDWPLQPESEPELALVADLQGVTVQLGALDLALTDINGQLIYQSQVGLSSAALTLTHQGLVQRVTLVGDGATALTLNVSGDTPVNYWGARIDDPFLGAQAVNIAHNSLITIAPNKTRIQSQSDLVGLELPLPAPLTKDAQEAMALALNINFDQRGWTTISANLDKTLSGYLELDAHNEVRRGTVAINEALQVRPDNGLYFDIQVEQADADSWWRYLQSFDQRYPSTVSNRRSFESQIAAISIKAEHLVYLAQPWTRVATTLLRANDAWLISFSSDEGQAEVSIPHGPEPIFADIQWVALTTGTDEIPFADQLDPLLKYLPSDVPDLSMQINKLIWNKRDLGNWRAEVRVKDAVMSATDIVGEMTGATLNGELLWSQTQGKHKSRFNGSIRTANLQDVLTTWGYAPVLTTRDGHLDIDTFWQGSPAHFDFKRLQGAIRLEFNQGAILDVPEYEGVKLIGLLNFTRVLNRIALDFSDLLRTGITFDTIAGELLFDRGFARVGEKLVIDGSATKFRFNGDADLLSDELDVDMTLTVPLSSTFPLVALLAGVSPQAAAAIYVTERVFNNQLERLSSARMQITGSFEAPETRFYRVGAGTVAEPSAGADNTRDRKTTPGAPEP